MTTTAAGSAAWTVVGVVVAFLLLPAASWLPGGGALRITTSLRRYSVLSPREGLNRASKQTEDRFKDDPEAIANRKRAQERRLKQVSSKAKKRAELLEAGRRMRERELEERRRARRAVERLPREEEHRLEKLQEGVWLAGRVTRLVDHGVWVDVGSQVDGFVHVSALAESFTHRPEDRVAKGDNLRVRVQHVDMDRRRLLLSCLEPLGCDDELTAPHGGERVAFSDLCVGQPLTGVVSRVTFFGAFVDVGALQHGFLHVSDYRQRDIGQMAPDVFTRGQKLQVYVKEIDEGYNRLKLTTSRPRDPAPQQEEP